MIDKSLQVIRLNDHECVTAMTVGELLDSTVPARNFLLNAKLDPLQRREVERLRELHQIIQRDFTGEKKRNAQGSLADYIQRQWVMPDETKASPGFLGPLVAFFTNKIQIDDNDRAHLEEKGILGDGESRGEAFLVNVQRMSDPEVKLLMRKRVAVHIVHGVEDVRTLAKYFADINGKGVGVNPNLVVMSDFTDPYSEVSKRVFEDLGLPLETRQRQVAAASNAVMTGLQARTMVAAVARGISAVQYGAKAIPADDLDVDKLESSAAQWLGRVFKKFGDGAFRDRDLILRAGPIGVCLGALGKAFYDDDAAGQKEALATLDDERIDWTVGPHWEGLAGKTSTATGVFTVGGGKEYVYSAWAALTKPDEPAGRRIRHLADGQEAA